MRDEYVGDVGDFGKYMLLNKLGKLGNGKIKIGVNWYYNTKPEEQTSDGRYINYLNPSYRNADQYKTCSQTIYEQLRAIVDKEKRKISEIEDRQILFDGTIFYSKPLPWEFNSPSEKKKKREDWFNDSLEKLEAANIVFLDPDNGIQTPNVRKTQAKAVKYVFSDEFERYYNGKKTVIIYNHRDRTPQQQYEERFIALQKLVSPCVLRFNRFSVRDYIFLPQKDHQQLIDELIKELTTEPFDFLFERYHWMNRKEYLYT